jgi:hypothetical protein
MLESHASSADEKPSHMVTDFVEHIDDVVDALEQVGDFRRRRHSFKLPLLRKSAPSGAIAVRAACSSPLCIAGALMLTALLEAAQAA